MLHNRRRRRRHATHRQHSCSFHNNGGNPAHYVPVERPHTQTHTHTPQVHLLPHTWVVPIFTPLSMVLFTRCYYFDTHKVSRFSALPLEARSFVSSDVRSFKCMQLFCAFELHLPHVENELCFTKRRTH